MTSSSSGGETEARKGGGFVQGHRLKARLRLEPRMLVRPDLRAGAGAGARGSPGWKTWSAFPPPWLLFFYK